MVEYPTQTIKVDATNRNSCITPLLRVLQTSEDEIELCSPILTSELEPSPNSGMREIQKSAPRKVASWIQKKYLGRIPQLSAVESKATSFRLVAEHEQAEQDGCKRTITYTIAPAKPTEFHGTPQFSSITPQQAMALYTKNHASSVVPSGKERVSKCHSNVWRAVNQKKGAGRSTATDDSSHNSATVGASKSFESSSSVVDGVEIKQNESVAWSPMSVHNLPKIC